MAVGRREEVNTRATEGAESTETMMFRKRSLQSRWLPLCRSRYPPANQTTASRPAVYSAAQATAGQASYQANCASCHQPTLVGQNEAPPLAGPNFMTTWGKRTTKDLIEYMAATMPPGKPSLAEAEYVNISAFILQFNGAPAGAQALTTATATPIGTIATGQRPATTAAARRGRWRRW